jgi:hypothetical protein
VTSRTVQLLVYGGVLVALCEDGTVWHRLPVYAAWTPEQLKQRELSQQSPLYAPAWRSQIGWHWTQIPTHGDGWEQDFVWVGEHGKIRREHPSS